MNKDLRKSEMLEKVNKFILENNIELIDDNYNSFKISTFELDYILSNCSGKVFGATVKNNIDDDGNYLIFTSSVIGKKDKNGNNITYKVIIDDNDSVDSNYTVTDIENLEDLVDLILELEDKLDTILTK